MNKGDYHRASKWNQTVNSTIWLGFEAMFEHRIPPIIMWLLSINTQIKKETFPGSLGEAGDLNHIEEYLPHRYSVVAGYTGELHTGFPSGKKGNNNRGHRQKANPLAQLRDTSIANSKGECLLTSLRPPPSPWMPRGSVYAYVKLIVVITR